MKMQRMGSGGMGGYNRGGYRDGRGNFRSNQAFNRTASGKKPYVDYDDPDVNANARQNEKKKDREAIWEGTNGISFKKFKL